MTSETFFVKQRVAFGRYFIDVRRSPQSAEKTVLLIHGIGVSGTYFMPFAEVLAKHNYDVHVLDLPGYGKTPRPDHALMPVELAEVVADYIKKRNLQKAFIIGQSMGCQTVAHLAKTRPELCEKVVLIGPTVNKWERSLIWQAWRLLQDTFREPLKANLIIFSDYFLMGIRRYLTTAKFMIDDHLESTIVDIKVPVLVVRGEKDNIAPRHWTQYLVERSKGISVEEIANAPHVVQYVKPKELWQVCEKFFNE